MRCCGLAGLRALLMPVTCSALSSWYVLIPLRGLWPFDRSLWLTKESRSRSITFASISWGLAADGSLDASLESALVYSRCISCLSFIVLLPSLELLLYS